MNTAFSRTSDSYSTLPMPAICLGFSGLVPFVTAAVASLIAEGPLQEMSERALLAYGAVILTFLGGIRSFMTFPEILLVLSVGTVSLTRPNPP